MIRATIKRKFSSLGFKHAVYFILRRIYRMLLNSRTLFFRIDFSTCRVQDSPANPEIMLAPKSSFNELTDSEQEALLMYDGPKLLNSFRTNFDKGYRLFLICSGTNVVGAVWVVDGGTTPFFTIPLANDEFFIISVFTIEAFRGKRIGTAALIRVLDHLKKSGYRSGFICTKEWNFYQKAIRTAGFDLVGTFREIHFFKKTIVIWYSVVNSGVETKKTALSHEVPNNKKDYTIA